MKCTTFGIVLLLLGILTIICDAETTIKQATSPKKYRRRCQKPNNGQHLCFCGPQRVTFDRLKGEKCVNEKVVRKINEKSQPLKSVGLRLASTPIHRSTRNTTDIAYCTGLIFKPSPSENQQAYVPLRNISVEAWIDTFAADVTLTQVFVNQEKNPIEAVYVFPIEENAAVYSFTAQIDDRIITAELKEKKKAEDEYQSAIEQGQTAVLMRQSKETLDTFTVNVGALAPGKECRVKIQYVTELDLVDENSIRFVVPTTIAPRYNPSLGGLQLPDRTKAEYVQNTSYSMWFQAHVLRGDQYKIMQVANLSHPLNVNVSQKTIDVSLESIALDRDIILDIDLPINRPMATVVLEKFNDTTKQSALLAFTPRLSDFKKISNGTDEINTEFIFIVDCSGSMMDASGIDLAREAMLLFIRSLPVGSHFNIIRFGSNYEILFKNETLTTVYDENTAKQAEARTRSMNADLGGTELLEPLKYLKENPPIKGRSRQIFLLTDGEISNTNEVIDLCRSMSSTTRIFSIGLGHSPSRSLVKGLARATNGHFAFVPPNSKVDIYVGSQFGRALQPSILNARLEWHGLSTTPSQAPQTIPPLYINNRVLIYASFDGDQSTTENVRVDLIVEGQKLSSIQLPSRAEYKRDTIRRLAAKALIQELQHQKSNGQEKGDDRTLEQRITTLSLNNGILSPYTAFVGVETAGPRINSTESKVRHVPIQISKGDEHLFGPPSVQYSFSGSHMGWGRGPLGMAGAPMAAQYPPMSMGMGYRRPSMGYSMHNKYRIGPGGPTPMYAYDQSGDDSSELHSTTTTSSLLSTDPVRWLIDQQSFNGAWLLNNQDIEKLTNGKSLSVFQSTVTNNNDALTTAVAIAVLESKHADQKLLWNALVEKARKRLVGFGLTGDQVNTLINEIKSKL